MKTIQIFSGSPRKNGNSFILANLLANNCNDNKTKIEISYLYDHSINGCIDCRACKKGEMVCILNDGMKKIYSIIDESDTIIIATPIYWFGPTGQTKLMLDRFRPYYANKKLKNKKFGLILVAGDGESDCDLTIEMFKRSFDALEIDFIDFITAKAFDIGEVQNDPKAIDSIKDLANIINNL